MDYEAIAMLNVSATQEIYRQSEAKDAEIAGLRAQLTVLEARFTRLEKALDAQPAVQKVKGKAPAGQLSLNQ